MPTIWDITSSPLSSGVNTKAKEKDNTLRLDESVIIERNFAELKLSGIIEERIIDITYFDGDGNKIWNYSISRE